MSNQLSKSSQLRAQIEAATARFYSTDDIESRIARALLSRGKFREEITAAELEVILRNVVYITFAQQRFAGRDPHLLHNVPIMRAKIEDEEADVEFVVHIHKPVVVFIEFQYTLINSMDEDQQSLQVKQGSLRVKERTKRFDIKAKTALAALNISKITRREMSDPAGIIRRTLPSQLGLKGLTGELHDINLRLNERSLCVDLNGDFAARADSGDSH